MDQLRLGLQGRIARPLRGQDFDQASERGFAVFRVLKLKAKLGGFIADKMGKRERPGERGKLPLTFQLTVPSGSGAVVCSDHAPGPV